MSEISRINTVTEYNNFIGQETLHPLVSVIDFSKIEPFYFFRKQMGIYAIFLKEAKCGNLTYGCNTYDYEEGTLLFIAPGQVYGIENQEVIKFTSALFFICAGLTVFGNGRSPSSKQ